MPGVAIPVSNSQAKVSSRPTLRRTCAAVLTNAPAIYGAASAYRSAKRLGHSVVVAERHYVDLLRELPNQAKTLEAALGIEARSQQIIDALGVKVEARKMAR